MNPWIIAIIVIIIIIVLIVVVRFNFGSTNIGGHSLVYKQDTLAKSESPIPNTSDGITSIFYGTIAGVMVYSVANGISELFSSIVVNGLAYFKDLNSLLALDTKGNLLNLGNLTNPVVDPKPINRNVTDLHSTDGGYSVTINGKQMCIGGVVDADGSYGLIQYTIK
jgi:hypothetical protein